MLPHNKGWKFDRLNVCRIFADVFEYQIIQQKKFAFSALNV